jgi:hypothetical protein
MLRFDVPRWDGTPLPDGTLLVHCEQGLGDTMQFVRFVPLARKRCGRLILAAQPKLIPLLAHSGFTDLVSNTCRLPPFDAHVPLLSLPYLFGADEASIPRDIPYLAVPPARIAQWGGRLRPHAGFSIGIAWQGHRKFHGDRLRSIPLECYAPLAAVPGVRLVSLQKGDGVEQTEALAGRFELLDLRPQYDDEEGAFVNAAAVMHHLDLVVSADTAVAHLAGALGVPVWVALPAAADWRWMLARADSPWYATMRLFRQGSAGDWQSVFRKMAQELAALIGQRAR